MLIRYSSSPRFSSHSCSLVSPLHQFSLAASPRSPLVDLLDALFLGAPELGLDHPGPHGFAANVRCRAFCRGIRWPASVQSAIDFLAENRYRRLVDFRPHPAV